MRSELNFLNELSQYHVTAFSAALIRDFQIAELLAEGDGLSVTSRFQAASISKFVCTVAVLALAAKGALSLDDDINRYFNGLVVEDSDGQAAHATIREILSHTAGFNVHGFDGYPIGSTLPTTAQIILGEPPCNSGKVILDKALRGTWSYSGGGFTVLQKCVENISGLPFAQMMRREVLAPLGMHNSSFEQSLTENIVSGSSGGAPITGGHFLMPEMAAAGLWTTPEELAKLGIHLQNILRGQDGLIPRPLLMEMLSPKNQMPEKNFYGLGCILKSIGGENFGHSGENIGFESAAYFSAEGGNGYCFMVNSDDAYPIMGKIEEQLARVKPSKAC